jgi:DNA-binding transcriptional regulator YiaG
MYWAAGWKLTTQDINQSKRWMCESRFAHLPLNATMEDIKRSINLMELRRKARLSRMQVAVALGVAEGTVAKWEQGKQEPHLPPWKMKVLIDLYQCSIEELVEIFPAPPDKDLFHQPINTCDELQLQTAS